MKQTATIQAICTRAQESFNDTNVGISVDFEIKDENYIKVYKKIKKLEKKIKEKYLAVVTSKPLKICNEQRPEGQTHLYYEVEFNKIKGPVESYVYNVAVTGTIYYAYLLAEELKDMFQLTHENDRSANQTSKEIIIDIAENIERYFLWEFTDMGITDENFDFDNEKDIEKFFNFLKNDENQYKEIMNELFEELEGEFGFKELNFTLPLWEYSPLRTSNENKVNIGNTCKNIKYHDIVLELDSILKD